MPIAILIASAAVAAPPVSVSIPSGPLDRALATLATQANIDVGGALEGLGAVRAPALSGRMTPARALDRLLAGTDYAAREVAPSTYRILRRRPPVVRPARTPAPIDRAAEIVITASKRGASLLRFPGSVAAADLAPQGGLPASAPDLHAFAAALPILQSTDLGAGRNKIFVRGVADSSFNGPTQGTTGVYFGDVQLGYSGPDPNLNLYDVARVEVLEGPQGTLYGAGAIGGVITLTPNAPDPAGLSAGVRVGLTATQQGAIGHDAAAMLNLPVAQDIVALRGVAYRTRDGGYIDDVQRHRRDVNRTTTDGGRLALRISPDAGWTIDFSTVLQRIAARDALYAERNLPGLARRSTLAQPFDDRFLLGRLVATHAWDSGLKLIAATGWVDRTRRETFDATRLLPNGPPLIYTAKSRNRLFTQEIRLSRSIASGASWVLGAAALHDREQFNRLLGRPDNPIDINGVTNRTTSLALFGEATVPVSPALALTAGGRLSRARTDGDPTTATGATATGATVFVRGKISFRLDPALGVSLMLAPRLAAFARYQSGFRTGGLAVARGIGRVADFQADKIGVVEAGLRLRPGADGRTGGGRGLSGSVAVSYADWDDIQADLVNARGLPFSSNIGQGEIVGLEAIAGWSPLPGLRLDGALFVSRSRLRRPVVTLEAVRGSALPNVPRLSAGSDASYEWTLGGDDRMRVFGGAHYRGHSVLGTGQLLGVRQGAALDQSIGFSWTRARLTISARLDNVADSRAARFALGNPFQLAQRTQYTPMRPRNLRIGLDYSW